VPPLPGQCCLQAKLTPKAASNLCAFVFPFAAGGSGDALARLLAEHLRTGLGVPVIVENKTGAAGRIGVQAVKGAPPDGSTILLTPIAPVAVYQHVYDPLGYDPAPISNPWRRWQPLNSPSP
jgi:tripartite-type tricarboxylate transporter receptor subunit TctC